MKKSIPCFLMILALCLITMNCAGVKIRQAPEKICVNVTLASFPFWFFDQIFQLKGQDPTKTGVDFSGNVAHVSGATAQKTLFILFNLEGMSAIRPNIDLKQLTRGYKVILTGRPQERLKISFVNENGVEKRVRLEAPGKYRLCNPPYGISAYNETAQRSTHRNYSFQEMNQLLN